MSGMKQIIAAIGKNDGLSLLLPKEALLHQFSAIVERSHSIFSLAAACKRQIHSVEIISYSSLKFMYYGIEMRAFFNSLMAALVVMALFWGNCFSCPQILLAAQKHGCCPHGKADQKECKTQGLRNFMKADPVVKVVPAVVQGSAPAVLFPASLWSITPSAPVSPSFSPPDLLPLRI